MTRSMTIDDYPHCTVHMQPISDADLMPYSVTAALRRPKSQLLPNCPPISTIYSHCFKTLGFMILVMPAHILSAIIVIRSDAVVATVVAYVSLTLILARQVPGCVINLYRSLSWPGVKKGHGVESRSGDPTVTTRSDLVIPRLNGPAVVSV